MESMNWPHFLRAMNNDTIGSAKPAYFEKKKNIEFGQLSLPRTTICRCCRCLKFEALIL